VRVTFLLAVGGKRSEIVVFDCKHCPLGFPVEESVIAFNVRYSDGIEKIHKGTVVITSDDYKDATAWVDMGEYTDGLRTKLFTAFRWNDISNPANG